MSTDSYKRRLRNLYRRDPRCHWCGELTALPETMPILSNVRMAHLPHMATTDHLISRLTGLRDGRAWPRGINTVLACTRCNKRRNDEELATIPIDELRRRAGQAQRFGLTQLTLGIGWVRYGYPLSP